MKKIFFALILLVSFSAAYAQTGTGWLPQRYKANFRDSVYVYKDINMAGSVRIGGLTVTSNSAEINILDGALVNTAELNRLVGVTSPIQAQINTKAPINSPAFTGTVRLPASTSIGNVSSTEISHVDGARSNYQAQLDDTTTFAEALDDNANYIQAMIDASLASYGGGSGTSGQYAYLSGITGVTAGFPGAGDSLVIHTNFIGRYPIVFREGNFQQRHENNLSYDGYRFNTTTGTLTFRPPFAAGEQLEIWATNTILYQQLTPEGGEGAGGEPPENVLLDNLRAYWSFDEVSGTTVSDKTGTYPGVSNGSTEPYGMNGYTRSYTRSHSHYSYFGATVGDMGTDDFSISLWYYKPELIEGHLGILGNWGSVPYWYLTLDEGSNNVYFQFNPSSPVNTYANSAPAASTWIHVAVTVDRSGDVTMYINGTAQTDVDDISASSAVAMDNNATFSVGRIGNHIDGYYFHGYIDDVALFRGLVLTQEQVTYLYNSGIGKFYPFN
jgi:hypothetical protein